MYHCSGPLLLGPFLSIVMPYIVIKYLSEPWRNAHKQKKLERKIAERKREQDNTAHYNDLMHKLNADA